MIASMKDWADFFASTAGGAAISIVIWLLFSGDCTNAAGFTYQCVDPGGAEISMGEIGLYGTVIGALLGFFIHLARSDDTA